MSTHTLTERERCLAEAFEYLNQKDWGTADKLFQLVITFDPGCGEAYFGRLLAFCKVSKPSELELYPTNNYNETFFRLLREAAEHSDGDLRSRLDDLRDHIYEEAVRLAETEKNFVKATELFRGLGEYRDAGERVVMCSRLAILNDAEVKEKKRKKSAKSLFLRSKCFLISSYFEVALFLLLLLFSQIKSFPAEAGGVLLLIFCGGLLINFFIALGIVSNSGWMDRFSEEVMDFCDWIPLIGLLLGLAITMAVYLLSSVFITAFSPIFSIIFYRFYKKRCIG